MTTNSGKTRTRKTSAPAETVVTEPVAKVTPIDPSKVVTAPDGRLFVIVEEREPVRERVSEAADKAGSKLATGAAVAGHAIAHGTATVLVDGPAELGEAIAKGAKATGRGAKKVVGFIAAGRRERESRRALNKAAKAQRKAAEAAAEAETIVLTEQ